MEKVINVVDFDGFLKRNKRNQLCLYFLKKENPEWTIKIWDETDNTVQSLLKSQVLNNKQFYGVKYEYLKLHLMLERGGLWMETDQIITLPEFNENYSYVQANSIVKGQVSFNFCTWAPVFINNKDEQVKAELRKAIQRFDRLDAAGVDYSKIQMQWESVSQTFLSVDEGIISQFTENGTDTILDIFGFPSFKDNVFMRERCYHFAQCMLMKEKVPYTLAYQHPLYDTILQAWIMSLSPGQNPLDYQTPDLSKVDFSLLQQINYNTLLKELG